MNIPEIAKCLLCSAVPELDSAPNQDSDGWVIHADNGCLLARRSIYLSIWNQWNRRQPTPEAATVDSTKLETMPCVCSSFHREVMYYGQGCPMCEIQEAMYCAAHPPKPEPTEAEWSRKDIYKIAIPLRDYLGSICPPGWDKFPSDKELAEVIAKHAPAAPKPPAEWMAELAGIKEQLRKLRADLPMNPAPGGYIDMELHAVVCRLHDLQHYSAPAGTEAAAPK